MKIEKIQAHAQAAFLIDNLQRKSYSGRHIYILNITVLSEAAIMNLSKKSRIVLVLLMAASSACFAQKWKGIVKGIEGRVGGNNNPQAAQETEENNAKKKTAKLSNNTSVQKKAAYLTKYEIALNEKNYNAAVENYNKAVKVKLPSNVDKSDADTLNAWATEIYARLQYANVKGRLK